MAFWIFVAGVAIYVAAAGYTDLRMQRIPNYLTAPMAAIGLVCALLHDLLPEWVLPGYPTTLVNCLLGFGLGFAIFFIPFFLGGGGSGDLKLVAALGAWLGWLYLLFALAFALIFAMVLAFVVWTTSFSARGGKRNRAILPARSDAEGKAAKPKARRRSAVPFAIPMALGAWCILGVMVMKNLYPEMFEPPSQNVPAEQRR